MQQQSLKNSATGDVSGQPKHRLWTVSDDTVASDFEANAYAENQVAALQHLIYSRFTENGQTMDEFVSERVSRTERVVSFVSRAGGIVALVAVLTGVVAVIF